MLGIHSGRTTLVLTRRCPAVPQNFADSRVRVKGRFVKKEDEAILLELNTLTNKEVRTTHPTDFAQSVPSRSARYCLLTFLPCPVCLAGVRGACSPGPP